MKEKGITATQELAQTISNWPAAAHDQVLRMIEARAAYFRAALKECGPTEFVRAFFEAFDEAIAEGKTQTNTLPSCTKGCYKCCRQNVQIWKDEAALIAEYCSENNIPIPRGYLLEQLKYGWKEVAKEEVGWCTFLKDGDCSIYPVRPLSCRKYLVASPAELCDTVKYPASEGNKVAVIVLTAPEIEASAYCGIMADKGKSGRLPEMLLPYSK